MTEEEAKTKWCPMVRLSVGHDDYKESHVAVNRWNGYASALYSKCIASDCMMWVTDAQSIKDLERWGRQGRCGLAK